MRNMKWVNERFDALDQLFYCAAAFSRQSDILSILNFILAHPDNKGIRFC